MRKHTLTNGEYILLFDSCSHPSNIPEPNKGWYKHSILYSYRSEMKTYSFYSHNTYSEDELISQLDQSLTTAPNSQLTPSELQQLMQGLGKTRKL